MSPTDPNQGFHVFDRDSSQGIEVDIVFVHGLRGHRIQTWSKGSCCWIRELLPQDMPMARVMTFGYDSSVAHFTEATSKNSIFGHAENLLNDLKDERRGGASKRPIIFVGHSLGGLVIKQALIRSNEYSSKDQDPQLGAILKQTLGIIFMATPHRGSDAARLGDMVCKAAKLTWVDSNSHLLDTLKEDSDVLEAQRASFATISKDMPLKCLYEELATKRHLIVGESSAVIDGFNVRKASIQANHIDVCKFGSRDDYGYKKVTGFILDILEEGKMPEIPRSIEVDRREVGEKRLNKFAPPIQSSTSGTNGGQCV